MCDTERERESETETERQRPERKPEAGLGCQRGSRRLGKGWGRAAVSVGCPDSASPLSHVYFFTLLFWRRTLDAHREEFCSQAQGQAGSDEKTERRGWRETGRGRPLPASPANPWGMI